MNSFTVLGPFSAGRHELRVLLLRDEFTFGCFDGDRVNLHDLVERNVEYQLEFRMDRR